MPEFGQRNDLHLRTLPAARRSRGSQDQRHRPAPGSQHGTVLGREGRRDRNRLPASGRASPAGDPARRRSRPGRPGQGADGRAAAAGRPDRRRSAGSRNSTAQTSAETGLPGRPSTGVAPSRPQISGLPGRMAICQKSSAKPRAPARSAPGHGRRRWRRRWSPAGRSPRGGRGRLGDRLGVSSGAIGSTTGSPPPARTRAARAWALELTMPPGGIGSPGRAISSPVARMPMRGRRCTASQGWFAGGGQADVAGGQPPAGAAPVPRRRRNRAPGGGPSARRGPPRRRCTTPLRGLGILLQQDGVGAGRHGAAGEDAHRLARRRPRPRRDARPGPRRPRAAWRRPPRPRRAPHSRPWRRHRPAAGSAGPGRARP